MAFNEETLHRTTSTRTIAQQMNVTYISVAITSGTAVVPFRRKKKCTGTAELPAIDTVS